MELKGSGVLPCTNASINAAGVVLYKKNVACMKDVEGDCIPASTTICAEMRLSETEKRGRSGEAVVLRTNPYLV